MIRSKLVLLTPANVVCLCILVSVPVRADILAFEAGDFGLNPTFSNVQTFNFLIDLAVPLAADSAYADPALNGVDYSVSGSLADGTPSGFAAFALVRSIGGLEYYSQGSSMMFEVDAAADLSDGLQVSELVGAGVVFEFDGREVDTGRYHPALFRLNADGTGSIRNSNNLGGINPGSGMVVDVDYGEEYITELTFDPATLTLFLPACGMDESVSDHTCVPCTEGTTNDAGDEPSGEDTSCEPIQILLDGFEAI